MDEIKNGRRSLVSKGFLESMGKRNPDIFGVSVPFHTAVFNEPLVFLSGAPAKSVTKKFIREVLGPKLVLHVRQLDELINGSAAYRQ